jgi:hypothetical protein
MSRSLRSGELFESVWIFVVNEDQDEVDIEGNE